MVIVKSELKKMIKNKKIRIVPFQEDQLGDGSIDMTLSNEFRFFKKGIKEISLKEKLNYEEFTKKVIADEVVIKPGEMILGMTKERLFLPNNLCGWIEGRSRFARIGLGIHVTSGFIQPGSEYRQVLEITNSGPAKIRLHAGDRIVQIVLEECKGTAKHKSWFKHQ
jgi:dCTP deaminase